MRAMFFVGKISRRRSAHWLVFPATLLLVTLIISRSVDSRISLVPSPSLKIRNATPTEANPAADLDHDGLPDISELHSFNDRENFRLELCLLTLRLGASALLIRFGWIATVGTLSLLTK